MSVEQEVEKAPLEDVALLVDVASRGRGRDRGAEASAADQKNCEGAHSSGRHAHVAGSLRGLDASDAVRRDGHRHRDEASRRDPSVMREATRRSVHVLSRSSGSRRGRGRASLCDASGCAGAGRRTDAEVGVAPRREAGRVCTASAKRPSSEATNRSSRARRRRP